MFPKVDKNDKITERAVYRREPTNNVLFYSLSENVILDARRFDPFGFLMFLTVCVALKKQERDCFAVALFIIFDE